MRRILYAFAPVTIAIVFALATCARAQVEPGIVGPNAAPPGPQPRLKILDPVYNFGTALQGAAVRHTFTVRNTGRGVLEIRGLKTSCGCTTGKPSRDRLEPGQDAQIDVIFDTSFQRGHRVRTITVNTNDAQNPAGILTLQGDVKVEVEALPEQVAFGLVHQGAELSRQVTISDLTGAKDFKVDQITNSSPFIKVARTARKDGKPGAILDIALLKNMPVGTFDDTVKIVTNRAPLQVDVFGTVSGDLNVSPPQVSFGIVPQGQDVIRILKLTNGGPHAVKVLSVYSNNSSVNAIVEPVAQGKEYKITVQLRRNTPKGQLHGQLAIRTDDPNQSTVTVPFYAIVGGFTG